jgi:hypothetical protein
VDGKLRGVNSHRHTAGSCITVIPGQGNLPSFIQLTIAVQRQWMRRDNATRQQYLADGLKV